MPFTKMKGSFCQHKPTLNNQNLATKNCEKKVVYKEPHTLKVMSTQKLILMQKSSG